MAVCAAWPRRCAGHRRRIASVRSVGVPVFPNRNMFTSFVPNFHMAGYFHPPQLLVRADPHRRDSHQADNELAAMRVGERSERVGVAFGGMEVKMKRDRRRDLVFRHVQDRRRGHKERDFDAWCSGHLWRGRRPGGSVCGWRGCWSRFRFPAVQLDRPPARVERIIRGQSAEPPRRDVRPGLVDDRNGDAAVRVSPRSHQIQDSLCFESTYVSFTRHPLRVSLTRSTYSTVACIPTWYTEQVGGSCTLGSR